MSMDMRNPGVLDKVPEYPKVNDDYVLVQKWIEDMDAYLLTRGLVMTSRNGKRTEYPTSIEVEEIRAANISDSGQRTAALAMIRDKKAKLDKQANGVIYGIMLAATRTTAPNLNRAIRGVTYYSLSDTDKDAGLGHTAYEYLRNYATHDTEALLDAKETRDAYCRPMPRYCTVKEWDEYLDEYDRLNQACGSIKHEDESLVIQYQSMLPLDLRAPISWPKSAWNSNPTRRRPTPTRRASHSAE